MAQGPESSPQGERPPRWQYRHHYPIGLLILIALAGIAYCARGTPAP
jgi:hypothetical protein